MTVKILNHLESSRKIIKGFKKVSDIVKQTLGPSGRPVIIQDGDSHKVTKDGVSIVRSITLQSNIDGIGVSIAKEIANKTVDMVGDGTTSAIVLSEKMLEKASSYINSQYTNMKKLSEGMELAGLQVVDYIKKFSTPIANNESAIKNIATISANNDVTLGETISDAFKKIGINGTITIENGNEIKTKCNVVKGLSYDKGYISSYFAQNSKNSICELENPYILIYDKNISSISSIIRLLEEINKEGRSLLIIAETVDGDALSNIIINVMRRTLKICCVNPPSFGDKRKEIMQDIAILTGGKYISEETGIKLNEVKLSDLGSAKKIKATKDSTIILDGSGTKENIDQRCTYLQSKISIAESTYEKDGLKERIAKMMGGIAVISVGGASETEVGELKDRLEDSLHAIRAAIEGGVVPGGGVSLIRAQASLNDYITKTQFDDKDIKNGFLIVTESLCATLEQMVNNTGESGVIVANEVKALKGNTGYNVATKKYEDLVKAGVIDPCLVVTTIVEVAISVIKTIACNGGCIYNDDDKQENSNNSTSPMMPPMM